MISKLTTSMINLTIGLVQPSEDVRVIGAEQVHYIKDSFI